MSSLPVLKHENKRYGVVNGQVICEIWKDDRWVPGHMYFADKVSVTFEVRLPEWGTLMYRNGNIYKATRGISFDTLEDILYWKRVDQGVGLHTFYYLNLLAIKIVEMDLIDILSDEFGDAVTNIHKEP